MRLVAAYAWGAAGLLAIGWLAPTDAGPLALLSLLAPYVALLAVVFIPIAIAARTRSVVLPLAVAVLLFIVRFGGEWTSIGAGTSTPDVFVATWNLQAGVNTGRTALAMLQDRGVDIVALQELTPEVAAAIDSDEALTTMYPHRVLEARASVSGMGILSRYPIDRPDYATDPVRLEARLRLPDGELVLIDAHPFHADLELVSGIPIGMDPVDRDRELALLKARVDELEAAGSTVLLMGDFNTAPTELAFGFVAAGLHDAHADVGWGPGWTWRPTAGESLGIGLLRIDRVLSTAGLVPVSSAISCPPAGDHCLVEAALALADP
jgi:vancomycin resistance protein VanJ